jgi:hypothetical protein
VPLQSLRRGDTVAFGHIRTLELLDGTDIKLGGVNTEKSGPATPAAAPHSPPPPPIAVVLF